jgi:uncharacterized membrane protein
MYMDDLSRYQEIDLLRGIAILMMVVFHTLFDLNFFSVFPVEVANGFWRYFAFATATLFLLVAGISLTLSRARMPSPVSPTQVIKKFFLRGAGIFLLGLLVTLCTWIYLKEGFIVFGILHLIGISVMLSPLFFWLKKRAVPAGLFCIGIGYFIAPVHGPIWLLPLGIHPASFWSVDYEPLFPWFGCVLIGMGLGNYLYRNGRRQFVVPDIPVIIIRPLAFLGRHSLVIYLIHQPIIILLLAALTGTRIF